MMNAGHNRETSFTRPAAMAALLTLAVYLPALGNDFVRWDDDVYVYGNKYLGLSLLPFLKWAFSTFHGSNWHPLTWISHRIDFALWGLNPLGHHLTNILLHAANVFLVVVLAGALLAAAGRRVRPTGTASFLDGRGAVIAAAATGLLFGIHPLHVESVAWVAERKDVLCGFFFLLSLYCYSTYVHRIDDATDASEGAAPRSARHFYFFSLAFFLLALLSKPMAVSLPVVLLVLDWHPFGRLQSRRSPWPVLAEKLPFAALSVLSSLLTVLAQRSGEAMRMLPSVPLWGKMLVAARALAVYLRKMVLPVDLSPFYPYPGRQEVLQSLPEYTAAAVLAAGATILLLRTAKKERTGLAVWAYYGATLTPVLGIMQVGLQSMADRYTYLPGLGPFFAAGIGAAWLWQRADALRQRAGILRPLAAISALVVCGALSFLTIEQTTRWRNGMDLWGSVIAERGDAAPLAYTNRGLAFEEMLQLDRALDDFDKAAALSPPGYVRSLAVENRSWTEDEKQQFDRALQDFQNAVSRNPADAKAYVKRGIFLGRLGHHKQAIADFSTAIFFDPGEVDAYTGRGVASVEIGLLQQAIGDYDRAIALNSDAVDAYLNRGVAFELNGQYEEALADYERVLALDPSDSLACRNRGMVLVRTGRLEDARAAYTRAIGLNPGDTDAYLARAGVYRKLGAGELSLRDYQKACELGSGEGCREAGAASR